MTARLLPYWYDAIVPDLRTGACVLVFSNGNTLRALVKHLDVMPEEQVAEMPRPIKTQGPSGYDLRTGRLPHQLRAW